MMPPEASRSSDQNSGAVNGEDRHAQLVRPMLARWMRERVKLPQMLVFTHDAYTLRKKATRYTLQSARRRLPAKRWRSRAQKGIPQALFAHLSGVFAKGPFVLGAQRGRA